MFKRKSPTSPISLGSKGRKQLRSILRAGVSAQHARTLKKSSETYQRHRKKWQEQL